MKRFILFFVLAVIFIVGSLAAFEQVRIKTIIDDPYRFREDTVVVIGSVTQYGEEKTKYSKYYYLKGDWGGIIKVVTDIDWPEVNERYEVRGIVVINDRGEVNLVERARKNIKDFDTSSPTTNTGQASTPSNESKEWMYYLIGLAAILLVVVIVLAVVMTSRKRSEYVTSIPGATGINQELTNIPEPATFVEGSTIKMAAPPVGTLKLLPGRFEVVSGDDTVKEIRFYKTKSQDETEITFGRGTGPHYSHIQLKPLTVSTKQAKLIWTNGKYTLINYSTVNPTIVNGNPLAKEGSETLEEGTRIEMGEVVFVFHER